MRETERKCATCVFIRRKKNDNESLDSSINSVRDNRRLEFKRQNSFLFAKVPFVAQKKETEKEKERRDEHNVLFFYAVCISGLNKVN